MSWIKSMELESVVDAARDKERKAFERYLAANEIRHQAWKEQQPDIVMAFVSRIAKEADEAHEAARAVLNAARKSYEAARQDEQPQPHVESPAAPPPTKRTTKTQRLQAALDEASKTCLPLVGAKVEYRNGQGFYIWHGKQVLGFVHNFKRGMFLVQEWQKTGRINYAELRAR